MNAQQAWKATCGQLQMEMSKSSYDTWVKKTSVLSFDESSALLTVAVPNAYARDWLTGRMRDIVCNKLSGMMARNISVEFVVATLQAETRDQAPAPIPAEAITEAPANNSHLNRRYRFENFVVGPCNEMAHAACMAVAEDTSKLYNPLFIHSGVGLGKTHLLHAIGNVAQAHGKQVLYISSEEFTNDLINAIRNKTTVAFRDKYRTVDVLLIDDIQFIAGKESTQEEFFHTFNSLYGQDKQIVMTSDRPPKAISTLEERLRSRFASGLIVDMQTPSYETRLAILQDKASKSRVGSPNDVLEMIAQNFQSNIRELEGAWTRVQAWAELSGKPLNLALATHSLEDFLPSRESLSPDRILNTVANFFGLESSNLTGRDRSKSVALPRQMAMYLMREESGFSLPRIGKELGGRDHSTVMYACNKVEKLLKSDEQVRRQVSRLREELMRPSASA